MHLGHSLMGLVDNAETVLVETSLISPRTGAFVDVNNFRITDLGIRFCENIQRYKVEKQS